MGQTDGGMYLVQTVADVERLVVRNLSNCLRHPDRFR